MAGQRRQAVSFLLMGLVALVFIPNDVKGFATITPYIWQQQQQRYSFMVKPQLDATQPSSCSKRQENRRQRQNNYHGRFTSLSMAKMSSELYDDDPFELLGLDPSNPRSIDKKEIKRAYKRMAIKYHPDIITTRESTPEEKKKANDFFAKVNWAYAKLSGKDGDAGAAGAGAGAGSSSTTGGAGYTPPHRRSGSSSSREKSYAGAGASANWEDYMPKYRDEDYDAGGDSFGAIFSDILAGTAATVAGVAGGGGGGVLSDFIDFLERNVEGYTSSTGAGSNDDAMFTFLLTTGSLEEVADEMDDTDLVVRQLTSKLDSMEKEMVFLQANINQASRYSEKFEMEAQLSEIEARKKVVQGYIKKARKRLLLLQNRYKELMVDGGDGLGRRSGSTNAGACRSGGSYSSTSSGTSPGGYSSSSSGNRSGGYSSSSSSSSWSGSASTAGRSSSTRSSTSFGNAGTSQSAGAREESASSSSSSSSESREGFGSFGRRGSSRRRSRSRPGETAGAQQQQQQESSQSRTQQASSWSSSPSSSSYSTRSSQPNQQRSSSSSSSSLGYSSTTSSRQGSQTSSTQSTTPSPRDWEAPMPPHRRMSAAKQTQADKRRLRELQVDEEFDNLKRELGL